MLRAIRDAPETSRGTESVCGEVECGGGSEFGLRLTMSRRTGPMPVLLSLSRSASWQCRSHAFKTCSIRRAGSKHMSTCEEK